jgi:hypothetical protein
MAISQKVSSEKVNVCFENNKTPVKKLPVGDIISDMPVSVITDPIDPKRVSKELTNSLTKRSLIKAGLVFLGTVGAYYLAKTTGIFSYFGWGTKNSKDVDGSEIMEVRNKANVLSVRRNLEAARQANNPLVNKS